ncbi:MAG: hypothetical protein IPL74_15125 [Bacteroidetes bacterium]|nr:hypothetical protein [Bacteroidota bacterium]
MKNILILKATKDICGNEVGLLKHHCQLLGMNVFVQKVKTESSIKYLVHKFAKKKIKFDYLYLCTHGSINGFLVDMGKEELHIQWSKLSQLFCETEILKDDTIFLLACCKGGLFQVATDILAVCNKINFLCGVKWNVAPWDLTTGFIVFIHNLEVQRAEPSYAATKASLATDYTFVCYDRDEIEINPQYEIRRRELFYELGWTNDKGEWIESDKTIKNNAGIIV